MTMDIRPLVGAGPWSLVEVADAAGVSYDLVYRDIRQGILPTLVARRGGRPRYTVSADNLRHSARPCYRHTVAATAAATAASRRGHGA